VQDSRLPGGLPVIGGDRGDDRFARDHGLYRSAPSPECSATDVFMTSWRTTPMICCRSCDIKASCVRRFIRGYSAGGAYLEDS
jgi:hypothetical protein